MSDDLRERSWLEFRDTKLLWFVNRILHAFGWAIVIEISETGEARCYPARTVYRGFPPEVEAAGYEGLAKYMHDNAEVLLCEAVSNDDEQTRH